MKIVITGAQSFIGQELKKHCRAKSVEYVGIDPIKGPEPEHSTVDIRSPDVGDAIPEGVDALIHLAAISRDQDCKQDPIKAFDVNVMGTLNLIQAAKRRKVKQFIFASSEWVYGEVDNQGVQKEDSVINANRIMGEYALSKIIGERTLEMSQLPAATVFRFGIVYGPRPANWSAVEMLFNAVKTQDTVEVKGSLKSARRFIHVSDIANGILCGIGRKGFEVFNLSGDRLVTLGDIIEKSSQLLKKSPKIKELNPQAISIRNPDNQKVKDALGWKPETAIEKGLQTLG